MTKNQYGVFEITVPAVNGQPAIAHDSKIKVSQVETTSLTISNTCHRSPSSHPTTTPDKNESPLGSPASPKTSPFLQYTMRVSGTHPRTRNMFSRTSALQSPHPPASTKPTSASPRPTPKLRPTKNSHGTCSHASSISGTMSYN